MWTPKGHGRIRSYPSNVREARYAAGPMRASGRRGPVAGSPRRILGILGRIELPEATATWPPNTPPLLAHPLRFTWLGLAGHTRRRLGRAGPGIPVA